MPAMKTYTRVNFQAYPDKTTQLSATNLNKMDKGIDDLDDEVVTVKNAIENMSFDANAISYDNTQSGLQATDVQDAVDEINDNLTDLKTYASTEEVVGTYFGETLYRKSYKDTTTHTASVILDASLTINNINVVNFEGVWKGEGNNNWFSFFNSFKQVYYSAYPRVGSSGVQFVVSNYTCKAINLTIYYTKI